MPTLTLTNTLSRTKESLEAPEEAGEIKLYTCGPTVYNVVHVGNLRAMVGKYTQSGDQREWLLTSDASTQRFTLLLSGDGVCCSTTGCQLIFSPGLGLGPWDYAWHHLVVIYDGAEKATDTTQFLFHHGYYDEARADLQGMVSWYTLRVADPER